MSITRSASYALCISAATLTFAACSSGGTQSPTPASGFMNSPASHQSSRQGLPDPARLYLGVRWNGQMHRYQGKSWMSPDAKLAPRLLFGANSAAGVVNVFRMPEMDLKGVITGFLLPSGLCSDRSGNIYIADSYAQAVYEYSRTGSKLNTYSDGYGFPESCAVNPTNGNLAVTNYDGSSGGAGQVLIYSSPSGSPTVLTNPGESDHYYFAGYDSSGDLWVDGIINGQRSFVLQFCGASSCSDISLSGGTIYFPGAVQWDDVRKEWVVFDQQCNDQDASCSYPVSASGALGTVTAYSNYNGSPACDIVQGVVGADMKKFIAGGDNEYCGSAESTFSRWHYPSGGAITNSSANTVLSPAGAAISTK